MTKPRCQPCQPASPLASHPVEPPHRIRNSRSYSSLSECEQELDDLDRDTSLLLPETPWNFSNRRHQHQVIVQGRLAFVRSVGVRGGGDSRTTGGLSPRLGSPAGIASANGSGGGDDIQGAASPSCSNSDGRASRHNMAVSPARATAANNVLCRKVFESGVSGTAASRRLSSCTYDEWFCDEDADCGEYEIRGRSIQRQREADGKRQLRGYGIGGAGNIRESFPLSLYPNPSPIPIDRFWLLVAVARQARLGRSVRLEANRKDRSANRCYL